MKRILMLLLCCLLLTACAQEKPAPTDAPTAPPVTDAPTQAPTDAPTEEPTEVQLQTFRLYHSDENAENFLYEEVQVPEINETVVTQQLIAAGVLPEGTAVNSFAAVGSQLNIDFNDAFLTQLNSMGTSGERMLVGSVVNTFLSAYGAHSVFFTVDGQTVESGHVIYDFPIEFME